MNTGKTHLPSIEFMLCKPVTFLNHGYDYASINNNTSSTLPAQSIRNEHKTNSLHFLMNRDTINNKSINHSYKQSSSSITYIEPSADKYNNHNNQRHYGSMNEMNKDESLHLKYNPYSHSRSGHGFSRFVQRSSSSSHDKDLPHIKKRVLLNKNENQQVNRYKCTQCSKTFSRPSSLRIHILSHTGEKPHVCPQPGCGRRFSVQSNMRRHLKVHYCNNTSQHHVIND